MADRSPTTPDAASTPLAHHRRDTRAALTLHAVLIAGLIVLWFLGTRSGLYERFVHVFTGGVF